MKAKLLLPPLRVVDGRAREGVMTKADSGAIKTTSPAGKAGIVS
jgi:hypothetical protein